MHIQIFSSLPLIFILTFIFSVSPPALLPVLAAPTASSSNAEEQTDEPLSISTPSSADSKPSRDLSSIGIEEDVTICSTAEYAYFNNDKTGMDLYYNLSVGSSLSDLKGLLPEEATTLQYVDTGKSYLDVFYPTFAIEYELPDDFSDLSEGSYEWNGQLLLDKSCVDSDGSMIYTYEPVAPEEPITVHVNLWEAPVSMDSFRLFLEDVPHTGQQIFFTMDTPTGATEVYLEYSMDNGESWEESNEYISSMIDSTLSSQPILSVDSWLNSRRPPLSLLNEDTPYFTARLHIIGSVFEGYSNEAIYPAPSNMLPPPPLPDDNESGGNRGDVGNDQIGNLTPPPDSSDGSITSSKKSSSDGSVITEAKKPALLWPLSEDMRKYLSPLLLLRLFI